MEMENNMVLRIVFRVLVSNIILALGLGAWIAALALPNRLLPVYCGCVLMDSLGYLHGLLKSFSPHIPFMTAARRQQLEKIE